MKVVFRILVFLLPFVAFGGETSFWIFRETNLWFCVATSPLIVVGQLRLGEVQNDGEMDRDHVPDAIRSGILVEDVLKGPHGMAGLSLGTETSRTEMLVSSTNCPQVFFFSTGVDYNDLQYPGEISVAPTFSMPASSNNIRQVKDEIQIQNDETNRFSAISSSFALPFDDEIREMISTSVSWNDETDGIERLCKIDLQRIPALLCQITNDIPLRPTTLAFPNLSEDALEPVARYEVSSTVGMISVVADRRLGLGIFSAYHDTTPAERRHLQSMWQVFVLRWIEQSKKAGKILKPAIVYEPGIR